MRHSNGGFVDVTRELAKFAALVAEQEREALTGQERDGHTRLMLHRWEHGQCWAAAMQFAPSALIGGQENLIAKAAGRLTAELEASIQAWGRK